ncbi:MAG: hypothetical protein LBT59_24460 [Clostridiales bacterium]|nr:hypothetical protein [Clostridiales bacterium]
MKSNSLFYDSFKLSWLKLFDRRDFPLLSCGFWHFETASCSTRFRRPLERDLVRLRPAYDRLHRLVSEEITISSQAMKDSVLNEVRQKFGVDGHFLTLYEYDGAGNRTARVDDWARTEYDYDANDRLLSDGIATYSYCGSFFVSGLNLEHIPKLIPRCRKNPALKHSPGFFRRHFGILGYALSSLDSFS